MMGTGPQGLMAILCARAMGAGRIIAVGSGARLALAESLGAVPIDYRSGNVVEQVRDLSDGLGIPAVVECAGTAAAIRDCCLSAAKGGVVSVIGIPHEEPLIPMKRVVLDEIEIVGDRANPNTAGEALSLLANGRVDLTPLLTHRFPLEQFSDALETFESRRDGAVKVAVKP
ncbi:MAG: zinc-binding dehydrogenase [Vicinamibacterales bacterium]